MAGTRHALLHSMWVAMVGMSKLTQLLKGRLKGGSVGCGWLSLSKYVGWDVAQIESIFITIWLFFVFI